MSEHIAWLTLWRRKDLPPGHYDDYHAERARSFAAQRRWGTAYLEAGAIWDRERSTALIREIKAMEQARNIAALYADGGVISRNPSAIGGTWAWRQVDKDGQPLAEESGVITPSEAGMSMVTNNLTELLALVNGLESLPAGWSGLICSDSNVSIGRLFRGWALRGVPNWLIVRTSTAMQHVDMPNCTPVLLDGHPSREQLEAGVGKRGNVVSVHNVWCDAACGAQAQRYLEQLAVGGVYATTQLDR